MPPTSSTVLRTECERTSQPLGTSGQSFGSGSAIASVSSTMRRSVPRGYSAATAFARTKAW